METAHLIKKPANIAYPASSIKPYCRLTQRKRFDLVYAWVEGKDAKAHVND